jgi:hypothetical protein
VTEVLELSKPEYYAQTGYTPHPGQEVMHYTAARFKIVPCGRRWGKTLFGAKEAEPNTFVLCPITGEAQVGWIVGPQYYHAEKEFRIVYDSLRRQGVDRDSIKFLNNMESGNMHIRTSWGFDLQCRSAAHPETLVSEGLNFVLIVEAGLHKRKTWQYIRPALSDRRGWALFTGVPEGKSDTSLLYALYQRGQSTRDIDRAYRSWRMPSWTNTIIFPGGRNDPEILDAEADLTEDEFNRQYGADFTEKVGAVMKEWEDDLHLGDFDYVPAWPLYMAVDYGFTNPFVVLWIQENPHTGDIYVIKERRWYQMDTEEVASDILNDYPGLVHACRTIYPDPAEPDDTRTLMRKLRVPAATSTGGDLKTRLALIRRALKLPKGVDETSSAYKPKLMVDRSCHELAWEMREGYRWPEHRSEVKNAPENPVDKNNHGVEALGRYFKGRFRQIMPGRTQVTSARW